MRFELSFAVVAIRFMFFDAFFLSYSLFLVVAESRKHFVFARALQPTKWIRAHAVCRRLHFVVCTEVSEWWRRVRQSTGETNKCVEISFVFIFFDVGREKTIHKSQMRNAKNRRRHRKHTQLLSSTLNRTGEKHTRTRPPSFFGRKNNYFACKHKHSLQNFENLFSVGVAFVTRPQIFHLTLIAEKCDRNICCRSVAMNGVNCASNWKMFPRAKI